MGEQTHHTTKKRSAMGAICCKCSQIPPIKGMPEDLRSKVYSYLLQRVYAGRSKVVMNPYLLPKLSYKRVPEFDSNYISVWDGPDPTNTSKQVRVIACRGTELRWSHPLRSLRDVHEDVKTYLKGFPDDLIHDEMSKIIEATPEDVVIDVCAHSLGTSLVLETYMKNLKLEDRVRRTYLFNPVYTPFHSGKNSEISRMFEDNQDCRWFMNTADIVSVEGQDKMFDGRWPKNVTLNIGQEPPFLHIRKNHAISQWNGKVELNHPAGLVPAPRLSLTQSLPTTRRRRRSTSSRAPGQQAMGNTSVTRSSTNMAVTRTSTTNTLRRM